jgi:hypothetical protein
VSIAVHKSRHEYSIINFGPNIRRDPGANFKVFHVNEQTGEATELIHRPVPKKGQVKLPDLEHYENYLIAVFGEYVNPVTTHEYSLKPHFHVTIEAVPIQEARKELRQKLRGMREKDKQAMLESLEKQKEQQAVRPRLSPIAAGVKRAIQMMRRSP